MKWSWILLLLCFTDSALAFEVPTPVHSCVAPAYAIRIFQTEGPGNHRIEIRGADLSMMALSMRTLIPNRDRLHFPAGRPRFECATISPDGGDSLETIRVYDGFVQVSKAVPGGHFMPIQFEFDRLPIEH